MTLCQASRAIPGSTHPTVYNHSQSNSMMSMSTTEFIGSVGNVEKKPMKYVVVTGGVISGVGKGIIASSTGVLLKSLGQRVTAIKIDPYLNIDAGTLSPYDHGIKFSRDL